MRPPRIESPLPECVIVPDDNRILYYRRDRTMFRFLSHFYPSPVDIDCERWATVEHFYQGQKSFDENYRNAIRTAVSPAMAKKLAAQPTAPRKISKDSWFKEHQVEPRADWYEVKLDIMRRADWAKYSQHSQLLRLLIATGDAELIEDSESEPFWGIGADGLGTSWAGRVLMEVRQKLIDSSKTE